MRFINHNKVYWVSNKKLKINKKGGHYVIITRFNRKLNLCRVKTITSLEHKNMKTKKFEYDYKALKEAKEGTITPFSIKELNTEHWSGINNNSKLISINSLQNTQKEIKKPKIYIYKK